MMRALALRLEGPMQSWGGPVAGDDRPSLDVPTCSGVIGLVAGALGIERSEVARLAELHNRFYFAVRVDRRGMVGVDFHTILDVPTSDEKNRKAPVISRRRYLFDASFAALLIERPNTNEYLEKIAAALRKPLFSPFLGRRSCPPSVPVVERNAEMIVGNNWRDLFAQVPLAPKTDDGPLEIYLDAELAPQDHYRPRRQRDVLIGGLPRLFCERTVHVVSWKPPQKYISSTNEPRPEETLDPWMP